MVANVALAARTFKNWALGLLVGSGSLQHPYTHSASVGVVFDVQRGTGDCFTSWRNLCPRPEFFPKPISKTRPHSGGCRCQHSLAYTACCAACRSKGPCSGIRGSHRSNPAAALALKRVNNVMVLPHALGYRTALIDLGGGSILFPSLFDKVDDRRTRPREARWNDCSTGCTGKYQIAHPLPAHTPRIQWAWIFRSLVEFNRGTRRSVYRQTL